MPTIPSPSPHARHFQLDPDLVYLNHGSFGAVPRVVHDAQRAYQARIERDAVTFFVEQIDAEMDKARAGVAPLLNVSPADIAFVPNATQGVATVLDNIAPMLRPGDELLANTHEYPACLNNLRRVAARTGAVVVAADLPFPVASPEQITDAMLARATPRTKLALISHTTSPSGLVLPVTQIVRALEDRGVLTLVDGAHGIGFVPVDLPAIGCSFYTTNCHKWLCAPKGTALLYVRADRRARPFPGASDHFRPMVLSNNAEKPKPGRDQFHTEFDYLGTADPSAIMALPDAVRFMDGLLPGGLPAVMRHNRDLVLAGRRILCERLGVVPPAPESMLGPLCTLHLPRHPADLAARLAARPSLYHDALQDAILARWKVQVPLWSAPIGSPNRVVRISGQVYNTPEQYEYLAQALLAELAAEREL